MHSLLFGSVEELGHFVFLLFFLVSIGKGDSRCCCHDPSSHASGAVHSQQGCHSFGPSEPAPGRTHGSTALLIAPRANHQTVCSCVFHVDSIRKSVHQLHVLVFFVALLWCCRVHLEGERSIHETERSKPRFTRPSTTQRRNKEENNKLNFASQTQSHRMCQEQHRIHRDRKGARVQRGDQTQTTLLAKAYKSMRRFNWRRNMQMEWRRKCNTRQPSRRWNGMPDTPSPSFLYATWFVRGSSSNGPCRCICKWQFEVSFQKIHILDLLC